MEKERGVLSFEEKHLVAIMMYLSINGQCRKIEIYQNVSSNPRIPEKLDRLESMGLIDQISDPKSRSIIIALTKKGREVADALNSLDKMIKEN